MIEVNCRGNLDFLGDLQISFYQRSGKDLHSPVHVQAASDGSSMCMERLAVLPGGAPQALSKGWLLGALGSGFICQAVKPGSSYFISHLFKYAGVLCGL